MLSLFPFSFLFIRHASTFYSTQDTHDKEKDHHNIKKRKFASGKEMTKKNKKAMQYVFFKS